MDDQENILEKLRDGLRNNSDWNSISESINIDNVSSALDINLDLSHLSLSQNYEDISSVITTSSMADLGMTVSPTIWGTTGITTTTGPNNTWTITDSTLVAPNSAKISLEGDDADIEINGKSLTDMIRGIQERLNILCPDPDMEKEWDELRVLREQYDAKLGECREKSKMWKTLKSMPPPEVK